MANITAIVGLSGAAKTLLMSNIAWREYLKGHRIFANYYLEFDYEHHKFNDRQKKGLLNFTPIFEPNDLKKIPKTSHAQIFLDEIDAFGADNILESGVDSYNFRSKEATATEKYFKKRLRKSNASAYYTVQQMAMVPKRIREETTTIFRPQVKRWRQTGDTKHPVAPQLLHYRIYKMDLGTGNFVNSGKVKSLNHPLGISPGITQDMLEIYDTNSDIFFKDDKTGVSERQGVDSNSGMTDQVVSKSGKRDPFRNPTTDESLFIECKKTFNHGTIVEKIEESGRYSPWKGDIKISPPGKQTVILDAVGVHMYHKDGITAKSLETRNKYDAFSEMINIDIAHNTKHYLAFYNKKIKNKDNVMKDWNIAPIDQNIILFKDKKTKPIYVKDLTAAQPLAELVF